jgi:SAM-dependent methyltransferase
MTRSITDIYTDIAAWFDRVRDKSLMEKAHLDRACAAAGGPGPLRVLDLGCGSGEPIAAYLIAQGHHVTGIDSAPPMIDLCRGRFPAHDWQVADMRVLDLGCRFDVVIAWHSFFHLSRDDQRAMFPVFARHLRAGGSLVFTSGTEDTEAFGEMQGHRVYHASLDVEEYRGLLAQNGFSVVRLTRDDAACGGHTVWIAQKQ